MSLGMLEGARNKHDGQGTSNRRFNFSNGTLELLWVHDEEEAINGPGRDMLLAERARNPTASPFGVIFSRKDNTILKEPFDGWKYEPVYFQPPWAFHIGANSNNLLEPLCVYMPFVEPEKSINSVNNREFKSIKKVKVYTPSDPMSAVLGIANTADRLSINKGDDHLIEVTFDNNRVGNSKDLRPDMPLIVHW